MGLCDEDTCKKIKLLMNKANIDENILDVVKPTLEKKLKENGNPVIAIKIGTKMITGKQTDLTTAPVSAIINAIKYLSNIPEDIHLLSPAILEPILKLKKEMNSGNRLLLSEVLTVLSICSVTNTFVSKSLSVIPKIQNSEAHSSYIITGNDKITLKELKINVTCESEFLEEDI